MTARLYIDTRPGSGTPFSPPPACSDYRLWLLRSYFRTRGPELEINGTRQFISLGGVHQAITAAMHAAHRGAQVTFIGPHRAEAALVFRQIRGGL